MDYLPRPLRARKDIAEGPAGHHAVTFWTYLAAATLLVAGKSVFPDLLAVACRPFVCPLFVAMQPPCLGRQRVRSCLEHLSFGPV
jgi:hypothetical protein